MIKCLFACETLAFSDSCVASFREAGCFATLLRLAVQEHHQNPSRELVVVTLAICVGRWGKVPVKSSHLLAVMFRSTVACGALASVALKLGLQHAVYLAHRNGHKNPRKLRALYFSAVWDHNGSIWSCLGTARIPRPSIDDSTGGVSCAMRHVCIAMLIGAPHSAPHSRRRGTVQWESSTT
jgi:hypothetical protein